MLENELKSRLGNGAVGLRGRRTRWCLDASPEGVFGARQFHVHDRVVDGCVPSRDDFYPDFLSSRRPILELFSITDLYSHLLQPAPISVIRLMKKTSSLMPSSPITSRMSSYLRHSLLPRRSSRRLKRRCRWNSTRVTPSCERAYQSKRTPVRLPTCGLS